jgi:DNA-directed RNA polymerase subunit M/transcription elongation factor TFIIS
MWITCPDCNAIITFKSDRTGNVRRYRCKVCDGEWIATVKGLKSKSAMSEPKNLGRDDMYWQRVLKDEQARDSD